jgi:hypothetical protein
LFFTLVDALSNVDALCVESYENATGVAVETVCGVVVADAINGRASNGSFSRLASRIESDT